MPQNTPGSAPVRVKQARAESILLVGCACCSCARGNNVCDVHVQLLRESAVMREQQQPVQLAAHDKQVVTCCSANPNAVTAYKRLCAPAAESYVVHPSYSNMLDM